MRILVTGATGFVGGAVVERCLRDSAIQVRAAVRREAATLPATAEVARVGDVGPATDWSGALAGVDAIVHLAARVHEMRDRASDPLAEFRRVNVAGTANLATQAAAAGVRRLVFVSSIKVNGEHTQPGRPFVAGNAPAPADPYGVSKHEAEQSLGRIAAQTGLEVVVVRPVLVYGPGVKANFRSMMRWLHAGVPLPFGAIHNRRSLLARDNLADLIFVCLRHSAAPNRTFLASDDEDLSTSDLLRRMARALGRRARLLPVPVHALKAAARLLGRPAIATRLFDSLQVDITNTRQLLEWAPPVSVDDAIDRTARHFLQNLAAG